VLVQVKTGTTRKKKIVLKMTTPGKEVGQIAIEKPGESKPFWGDPVGF